MLTVSTLREATRWPDDPTREFPDASIVKWGAKLISTCKHTLEKKQHLLIHEDGLLCSTHFGPMQFWHAQASSPAETADVTYQHILDWIKFNYLVATSRIKYNMGYCEYFNGDENKNSITQILMPANYAFCTDRPYMGIFPKERFFFGLFRVSPYPAYDIATLYGLTCSNPVQSKTCTELEVNNDHEREIKTRRTATGAILHVIQDSYARAHVVRETGCEDLCPEKAISRIDCSAISMFTTYGYIDDHSTFIPQDGHDDSDDWPDIGKSCTNVSSKDHNFDDPITASAKVLWHVKHRSEPEVFLEDIARVFNNPGKKVRSGPGVCYEQKIEEAPVEDTAPDTLPPFFVD